MTLPAHFLRDMQGNSVRKVASEALREPIGLAAKSKNGETREQVVVDALGLQRDDMCPQHVLVAFPNASVLVTYNPSVLPSEQFSIQIADRQGRELVLDGYDRHQDGMLEMPLEAAAQALSDCETCFGERSFSVNVAPRSGGRSR